jgi:uncharacterized protein YndB with AHSA1/START domain
MNLLLAMLCATAPLTVTKLDKPEKALRLEAIVPAPVDEVWKAFTTSEGLETWIWRKGGPMGRRGLIEASEDAMTTNGKARRVWLGGNAVVPFESRTPRHSPKCSARVAQSL